MQKKFGKWLCANNVEVYILFKAARTDTLSVKLITLASKFIWKHLKAQKLLTIA